MNFEIVLERHDLQASEFLPASSPHPFGHYLATVNRVGAARRRCPRVSASICIRLALAGEAPLLSALCVRSKAHWGYDARFMQLAHQSLQIDPAAIDALRVFVAAGREGGLLGVADCCALTEPGAFDLVHLFVEPKALRRGIGRALFEAACAWCVAQGGSKLMILSDPNAAAFYQRLGARPIGEAPSDAVAGRLLPLFEYPLGLRRPQPGS